MPNTVLNGNMYYFTLSSLQLIRKIVSSILQMRILKLGEFKLEGESKLGFRQFGGRSGNPNLCILLSLLAVTAQACNAYILFYLLQVYYII